MLPEIDRLAPQFSQRVRANILRCQNARGAARQATEITVPRTVEEFLRAASDAGNQIDRHRYLSQAAQLAAQQKDFDRALTILDSMAETDKDFSRDTWEHWRWDYGASAACNHRKNENLQQMNKVIEDTPPKLRGFVRIALASQCDATARQHELIHLLGAARKDLEKAEASQQPVWYVRLVALYAKLSPDTAPEILSQTVAAINRSPQEQKDQCPTSTGFPPVLGNQILLDQYKLPVTLLDADEAGVLNSIRSVQPAGVRAVLRLQLLAGTLDQKQKTANE